MPALPPKPTRQKLLVVLLLRSSLAPCRLLPVGANLESEAAKVKCKAKEVSEGESGGGERGGRR